MTAFFSVIFLLFIFQAEAIEKIEVTGSRVKRIDIEGPAPILILDKEDLEKSGYNSIGDVLRDTLIAPFGLKRESSGSSLAGESFANVHGAQALVLINGERLVEDPNAEAVDLNLIPIFAVERIEIVKDGSSALYGSDALGGVINFIMKKNFEGTKFYGRYTQPFSKGGSRLEVAALAGKTFDNGLSVTGVLQYRKNDKIFAADRVWSENLRSPTSPYGVFRGASSGSVLNPLCPEEKRIGKDCYYSYSQHSTTLPSVSQLSSYFRVDYKSRGIRFYNQSIFSYKDIFWVYAPLSGELTLPSGHKWNQFLGEPGKLDFRFAEAGNRETKVNSFVFDLTFGAQGYLSAVWDWDLSAKIGRVSKEETADNLLVLKSITNLIASGAYDPFAVDGQKGDISSAKYNAVDQNFSNILASTLDFSGEMGVLGVAWGFQALFTGYEEIADEKIKNLEILSSAGSDGSGDRWVFSAYQEAVWPYGTFELQGALRSDYYSDFGFTMNPKGAFRWQPASTLLFRGSVGTSFIAPTLEALYGSVSTGFPSLIDTVACYNELTQSKVLDKLKNTFGQSDEFIKDFLIDQRKVSNDPELSEEIKEELKSIAKTMTEDSNEYCSYRQYISLSGGNKKLKETKAIVGSVGTVWQATSNVSLAVDAWYIKTNGSPADGVSKSAIDAELKFGSDYIKEKGVLVTRDQTKKEKPILRSSTGEGEDIVVGIKTALLNIGSSSIAGVDTSLEVMYPKSIYGGNAFYQNDAALVVSSSFIGFPGLDPVDNIGKSGLPRWRMINTLGWRNKNHEISFKAYTVSSVGKESNELESIPSYTRFDLFYQLIMTSKTSFNMGWSNILFSHPVLDDTSKTSSKINESLHEVRGSYIYAGFSTDI